MSFIPALRNLVNQRRADNPNDPLVLTFDCLWNHEPRAIGPTNAVPISMILEYLAEHGVDMSYNGFQQGPLNETRSANAPIFIGTHRGGCFLIDSREHFDVAREFYDGKIAAMETNRGHLLNQGNLVTW
jgi:hypothetical protein